MLRPWTVGQVTRYADRVRLLGASIFQHQDPGSGASECRAYRGTHSASSSIEVLTLVNTTVPYVRSPWAAQEARIFSVRGVGGMPGVSKFEVPKRGMRQQSWFQLGSPR
jgi:hypothetical protein